MYWPRGSANAEAGPLLGLDFDPANVNSLVIEDVQDNLLEFTRSGVGWVLASGGNYPAEGEKIEDVLVALQKATTSRLVTRTKASHARLSVADDDYSRKLTLTMKDGKALEILVGTDVSSGSSHVRLSGSEEVYQADDLSSNGLSVQPSGWIDAVYLALPDQTITKMVLTNPQGTFTFEKNAAGTWESGDLPAGETLAATNVTALENSLKSMRMVKPLGEDEKPGYGLADPAAKVEYFYSEVDGTEKSAALLVGNQLEAEGNNYVIKSSTSTYYVTASPGVVGSFVNRTLQDFIQPKPTATVEATAVP